MQFLGNTVHKKGKEIAQIAQIELALRARVILLVVVVSLVVVSLFTRAYLFQIALEIMWLPVLT